MAQQETDEEGNNYLHKLLRRAEYDDLAKIESKLIQYFSKTPKEITSALINQRNIYGQTPFMILILCHTVPRSNIVSLLINFGCDINMDDNLGMTPVHRIVQELFVPSRILEGNVLGELEKHFVEKQNRNEKEVLKILCASGSDVNKQDLFGRSSIFLANDIEVIRMLIKHGADVNMTDQNKRTILHSVLSKPNCEYLFPFFMSKVECKLVAAPDLFGSTFPHYCAILNRQNIFEKPTEMTGISLKVKDNCGNVLGDIARLRSSSIYTTRVKKLDVVHYNEIFQNDDASVAVNQIMNTSEVYDLLNSPGLGTSWHKEESKLIISTVVDFVEFVCKRIGELDSRFSSTLFRSGSSSEGTKIGDPIEFDFIFCLEHFSSMCKVLENQHQKGFAELQAENTTHSLKRFFDKYNICKIKEIRFSFSNLLKRIVFDKTTWTSSNLQFNGEVRHLEEYDRPVFTVKLRWFGCLYKDEEISVDIVPAVRKKGWWPSDTNFEQLEMMTEEIKCEGCLLLLQNPYFETDTLLKISCSPAEKCLMTSLPSYFIESYRLCKILRHKSLCPRLDPDPEEESTFPVFEAEECITSYMLKNCLFHILKDCKEEGLYDSKRPANDINLIILIAVKILRYLDSCIASETLPVYFLPKIDVFSFNPIEIQDENEADVIRLNHFHCLRCRAFLRMMMHIIGQKIDIIN